MKCRFDRRLPAFAYQMAHRLCHLCYLVAFAHPALSVDCHFWAECGPARRFAVALALGENLRR